MNNRKQPPKQDPAEGSREVVDNELQRTKKDFGTDEETHNRARKALKKQIKEDTERPQKGSV